MTAHQALVETAVLTAALVACILVGWALAWALFTADGRLVAIWPIYRALRDWNRRRIAQPRRVRLP